MRPSWIQATTEGLEVSLWVDRTRAFAPVTLAFGGLGVAVFTGFALQLPAFALLVLGVLGCCGGAAAAMRLYRARSEVQIDLHRIRHAVRTRWGVVEERHVDLADIHDAIAIPTNRGLHLGLFLDRTGSDTWLLQLPMSATRDEAEWLVAWIREHAPKAIPGPELTPEQLGHRQQLHDLLQSRQ